MTIGENIRKYRKQNGMTQTELANKINKSLRTVQKYESNEAKPPVKLLKEISDIFNIYIEDLTNTEDEIDIYKSMIHEYVDQRIERMTDDEILTRRNKIIYENQLENKECLYTKLDGKQLELLYQSKINDLENIIKSQLGQIELSNKLNDRQGQMLDLLLEGQSIDDILDKKAEERMLNTLKIEYGDDMTIIDKIISHKADIKARELLKCKTKINKILEGDK